MELAKKLCEACETLHISFSTDKRYEFCVFSYNENAMVPILRLDLSEWSVDFLNELLCYIVKNHNDFQIRVEITNKISHLTKKLVENVPLKMISIDFQRPDYITQFLEFINLFNIQFNVKIFWRGILGDHLLELMNAISQINKIDVKIYIPNNSKETIEKFLHNIPWTYYTTKIGNNSKLILSQIKN